MSKLTSLWSRDRIDIIAAILGLLLGIVISLLNLIYTNAYLITMGPLLAAACLLYLVFRRKWLIARQDPEISRRLFVVASIIFFVSLAVAIGTLHTELFHRPLLYFILIAVAASAIAVQILHCPGKSAIYLILFEILLLSLSVRASAYWVLPTIPGSDTWYHRVYAQVFVANAGIPDSNAMPGKLGQLYLSLPLMHLGVVAMKLVAGIDYKAAMFFAVSLPLILSTLFVFLFVRHLANAKVGLLAMLLLNLCDFHIAWSVQPIPTTLGVAFFPIIIYLVIRDRGNRVPFISVAILLMVALVMTHTVSAFVMLCFMLFLLIGMYLYRLIYKKPDATQTNMLSPTLVVLFAAVLFGYWSFAAYVSPTWTFFDIMAEGIFSQVAGAEYGAYAKPIIGADYIVNFIGFLILLLFAIWGALFWCSREHSSGARIGLVAALTAIIAIPFGSSAFGIGIIIPDRWLAFDYVALSVVAAVGIFIVISHRGYRWVGNISLICVVFAASFFMITDRTANMDSPVYTPELSYRMVYTNAEMAMAERVVEVFDGTIITDVQYSSSALRFYLGRIHNRYHGMPNWVDDRSTAWSEIESRRSTIPAELREDDVSWRSGIVLWRDVMATTGVQAPRYLGFLGADYEQKLDSTHHLVYTNGDGKAYLARERHV